MRKEIAEKLEKELADWRTRLDALRVKASLGKMELRDREKQLLEDFQPAYEAAMSKLGEAKDFAESEAKAVKSGLEAGWKELRKTYDSVRAAEKK
jgi:predicted  nucleic acid-binding Zn-ribbon protein